MRNDPLVVGHPQAALHLHHRTAAVLAQAAQAQVIVIHQVTGAERGLIVARDQEAIVETGHQGQRLVRGLVSAGEAHPLDVKDENTLLEDAKTAISSL